MARVQDFGGEADLDQLEGDRKRVVLDSEAGGPSLWCLPGAPKEPTQWPIDPLIWAQGCHFGYFGGPDLSHTAML